MSKLTDYFTDIAYKRLSAVEADKTISHQHEFNGIESLRDIFGDKKLQLTAKFIYLGESLEIPEVADAKMTWYDAREKHLTRSEHRLYYETTPITKHIAAGDLMVIAKRPNGEILVLIAEKDTTFENQIAFLFELPSTIGVSIKSKKLAEGKQQKIDFVSNFILEQIGIDVDEADENYLPILIKTFPNGFPTTLVFSEFARNSMPKVKAEAGPDEVLLAWMEREEILFRTLEKHMVADKIKSVNSDVDKFIELSLSIQNRRKARVGYALENHLEKIFSELKISFSRGAITELHSKPDFIFPGIKEYRNPKFSPEKLFMLGSKSTCKDRWRQVLSEANRIKRKHLLTLEPGISKNQTNEMKASKLSLVIPSSIQKTYSVAQRKELLTLKQFIDIVR